MVNCSACGNDIIDLSCHQQTSWRQDRFLSKIFTELELQYFISHPEIDLFPEMLFTCKESAYKFFVKQARINAFNPRSFDVTITRNITSPDNEEILYSGKINCNVGECFFLLKIKSGCFIHTICYSEKCPVIPLHFVIKDAEIDNTSKSEHTYFAMIKFLKENFIFNSKNIEIIKNDETQIPYLYINSERAPFDISLSHDGSYLAGCVVKNLFGLG